MRILLMGSALLLAACEHTPVVERPVLIAPASCTADLEPAPVRPTLTQELEMAADMALIRVLGPELAAGIVLHDQVAAPERTKRLEKRILDSKEWCESLR